MLRMHALANAILTAVALRPQRRRFKVERALGSHGQKHRLFCELQRKQGSPTHPRLESQQAFASVKSRLAAPRNPVKSVRVDIGM